MAQPYIKLEASFGKLSSKLTYLHAITSLVRKSKHWIAIYWCLYIMNSISN